MYKYMWHCMCIYIECSLTRFSQSCAGSESVQSEKVMPDETGGRQESALPQGLTGPSKTLAPATEARGPKTAPPSTPEKGQDPRPPAPSSPRAIPKRQARCNLRTIYPNSALNSAKCCSRLKQGQKKVVRNQGTREPAKKGREGEESKIAL